MKKGFFVILLGFLIIASAAQAQEVQSVNFIQEGETSKLIIDFDKDVFAERKHITDDKQIILDIKNAKAQDKFLRGIDTSEFSGSAVYVSAYKKPGTANDLRFAIQLRDNVRSILEKKNNRVVLHIENRFGVFSKKKLEKAESVEMTVNVQDDADVKINVPKSDSVEDILDNLTLSGVKKYVGKKISINVNNVPYQDILRMIADTSGFNIIIDNEVNKLAPLTLSLTNIPWDQALDTILELGNLVAEKHSNILTVRTEEQARKERLAELQNLNANREQEPLVTKIFPLSFADRKSLSKILQDYLTPERGNIQSDERTNNLIVRDTVDVIERIKKIIETLDTQTPQILIESKIVEAKENYQLNVGLSNGIEVSYDPLTAGGSLADNSGTFQINTAPTTGEGGPGVFNASINVFKRIAGLNFQLNLLESENKARIITAPKIITQNNQEAVITSTDTKRFNIQTRNDQGNIESAVEEIDVTISLKVTPNVTNDGSIAMNLAIEKAGFVGGAVTGQLPETSARNVNTNVLVDNGSTLVIAGLYQTDNEEVEEGIPFLKDLPLIGWLFRSAYQPKKNRNELMIFLTPRIINQEEAGLASTEGEGVGI
jgi:type IV pilus assembly protein PilQ